MSLSNQIDVINKLQNKLEFKKNIVLEKAINSENYDDLIKANTELANIQTRMETDRKSTIFDPMQGIEMMGYREKPAALSYQMLRSMSKTPIINAIIKTRLDQIASFAEPQRNKYTTGYIIQKKRSINNKIDDKLTPQEEQEIEEITNFIENCGVGSEYFECDDFDTFVRKFMRDSLVYDQCAMEVFRNNKGQIQGFIAPPGDTFRIASTYDDDKYQQENYGRKKIKGYYPSYVQIINQEVYSEYYPWELCFGIRNPDSNLWTSGYGTSELEEMITVITSMLYADEYNRRFFMQGSVPKGLIKISGNIGEKALKEFKQQWKSMMSGVYNAWKTPIMEADKMDYVDIQKTNRDMEYGQWQEYLIKLGCAIYRIDPAEINFPMSGSADAKPMFEGNNEARLKHSKDKGLYPLLKFLQKRLNKHVVSQINPNYELIFTGLDSLSEQEELDMDIAKVGNIYSLDEIRKKHNLKPMANGLGVYPLNGIMSSLVSQKAQAEMLSKQIELARMQGGGMEGGQPGQEEEGGEQQEQEESPIQKAFENYLQKL